MRMMKNTKLIILGMLVMSIVIFMGCSKQNTVSTSSSIHNMNGHTTNFITKTFSTTEEFKSGNNITFNYKSQIKKGNISMKLIDPSGKELCEFQKNKTAQKDINIYENGTYQIVVSCNKFKGSYEIEWTGTSDEGIASK